MKVIKYGLVLCIGIVLGAVSLSAYIVAVGII